MVRVLAPLVAFSLMLCAPAWASEIDDALAASKRGDDNAAIAIWTNLLSRGYSNTDEATLMVFRGEAYNRLGQKERALADFDAAIQAQPDSGFAFFARASFFAERNMWDQSIPDWDNAIRHKFELVTSYYGRATAYFAKSEWGQAIQDYSALIAIDPSNGHGYRDRGQAYIQEREWALAKADYTEAIRLLPSDAGSYYGRAVASAASGDYKAGIADLDEAILLRPGYVLAYVVRGEAYFSLAEYDRAIADDDHALQLMPDQATAYKMRGLAHFVTGNFAAATEDFQWMIRAEPRTADWVLFLHISRIKMNIDDGEEFRKNVSRFNAAQWPGEIFNLYLGRLSLAAKSPPSKKTSDQECFNAFFIGEYYLLRQEVTFGKQSLSRATSICPHNTDSSVVADAELRRLGNN